MTNASHRLDAASSMPRDSLAAAVISFGRLLKGHGLTISVPAVMDALAALSVTGVSNVNDFKTVLRSNLMTRVEDGPIFERLFAEFWLKAGDRLEQDEAEAAGEPSAGPAGTEPFSEADTILAAAGMFPSQEEAAWDARPYVIYSPHEVLKERDFKEISSGDDARIESLIREIVHPLFKRVGVRKRPFWRGVTLDFRKLFRRNVLYGGDIVEIPRLRPKRRLKKLVFLCDVSGSMNPYMRFMLRFIRELQEMPTKVETFAFATRLTRITSILRRLPFPRAMEEIGHTVRDWSGGTRIGSCLEAFTSSFGESLLRPSTVILIHSDGWDRGDVRVLEREMARIQRRAYRVIWINPLLGGASYEPTCRGMRTALPYVDAFLPGHNVLGLERVAGTLRTLL
ncbi:MAG: VWA domain-containing protein [Thermodesulfobacteriota bacterium]